MCWARVLPVYAVRWVSLRLYWGTLPPCPVLTSMRSLLLYTELLCLPLQVQRYPNHFTQNPAITVAVQWQAFTLASALRFILIL
ncbi:hypothetical protein SAMN05216217_11851 [Halopseudomonas yangmingensis]|uniref:Uncharacterized protein n=1 Tax=Halopseudomonas yangmingensis TaxID=1720063 RepID=A0A1I4U7V7_9GAMM|nr:hypothetical protein SAMN05216217_11851 [Halopseudomonas yangmingensis]